MSQPSIACYFATRKRTASDDLRGLKARKVLKLDTDETPGIKTELGDKTVDGIEDVKQIPKIRIASPINVEQVRAKKSNRTINNGSKRTLPRNQQSIQTMLRNLEETQTKKNVQELNEKTPPTTPVKNSMDNIQDLGLDELKQKLSRSSRLAELKASIAKFNKSANKLEQIEVKKKELEHNSPTLKQFKSIEIEVQISPKKYSPVKPYLSPKKELTPRKNLFGLSSPGTSKQLTSPIKVPAYQRFQTLASPGKPSLTLPYKYRSIAEMFRSIDTVAAMLHNRKETITFSKLKPAVQEMIRRDLTLVHFRQLKTLYPDAFEFSWEKLKTFASVRSEKYELVVKPVLKSGEMTPTCLLERRRKLYQTLIDQVMGYHNEFLLNLDPPMSIVKEKLTRWHPEFNLEQLPDVSETDLPTEPEVEILSTGQEVLEKAKSLFNCNTRLERALEKLKESKQQTEPKPESGTETKPSAPNLKGIPKALLEKIRTKQAAKALEAMTRSEAQVKESVIYSRLPDLARLLRNTFVAEKKGVLPLEEIIKKLNNSYRSYLTNAEIEEHLRLLSKILPGWIVFHEIRRTLYIKLSRDGDMTRVMNKLEELAKSKNNN